MSDAASAAVDAPVQETVRRRKEHQSEKPKRQPRYNVILWNDDDHTYQYVIAMMMQLFGHTLEKGLQIASNVDTQGRAIVLTTTKEHAELKRDQIHAFGKDPLIDSCEGAMWSTIEPIEEE
jgi:ATP-dependent Clp protease adaptor protein ClpS